GGFSLPAFGLGFSFGGVENLALLTAMGVAGLYMARFLVEALVEAMTGSRALGSLAGMAAFGLAGYAAMMKIVVPAVTSWFNSLLAPLTQITSMMY
ncbi:MAG: hypothetical protein H5T97_02730, partial [Firmicutes bacterium]|nr:hypothetical protein [Bacillota bacterium]